jgi:hypothetical protein
MCIVECITNEYLFNNCKSNDITQNSKIEKFDVSKKSKEECNIVPSNKSSSIKTTGIFCLSF